MRYIKKMINVLYDIALWGLFVVSVICMLVEFLGDAKFEQITSMIGIKDGCKTLVHIIAIAIIAIMILGSIKKRID